MEDGGLILPPDPLSIKNSKCLQYLGVFIYTKTSYSVKTLLTRCHFLFAQITVFFGKNFLLHLQQI